MSAQEQTRQADKTVVAMPGPTPAQTAAAAYAAASSAAAAARAKSPHSAFVPVLLGLMALTLWLGWQTSVLMSDRDALNAAHAGQQQTVDNASKLRASLDGLAADTQRLAEAGNGSAALLVAELKKRGITINPQAATPAAATPR